MKCEIRWLTSPNDCYEAALFTQGKVPIRDMPIDLFCKMIIAEHSPIRSAIIRIKLYDIPDRASVHLVRHVHSLHFVKTNRPDITGKPRATTTNHMIDANIEALLAIGRKRLCKKASEETRLVAQLIKYELENSDDKYLAIVGKMMVPNCQYRGKCVEIKTCKV